MPAVYAQMATGVKGICLCGGGTEFVLGYHATHDFIRGRRQDHADDEDAIVTSLGSNVYAQIRMSQFSYPPASGQPAPDSSAELPSSPGDHFGEYLGRLRRLEPYARAS